MICRSLITKRRAGSLMVEMVVCTVLLSVVAAVLVPGIHAVHGQRKATRFETYALIELENQAAMLKQTKIPADLQLSSWFTDRYTETQFTAKDVAADATSDTTQTPVRLTITRPSADAKPDVVRSLVVWVDRQEAAE